MTWRLLLFLSLLAKASVAAGAQPAGLFDGTAGLVETTSELSVPPINHPHSETAIAFWPPSGEYVMLTLVRTPSERMMSPSTCNLPFSGRERRGQPVWQTPTP